jgi:hypothetical protein
MIVVRQLSGFFEFPRLQKLGLFLPKRPETSEYPVVLSSTFSSSGAVTLFELLPRGGAEVVISGELSAPGFPFCHGRLKGVRIRCAERQEWEGTKRLRTAEKIEMKCCSDATGSLAVFAPAFETASGNFRPGYSSPYVSGARPLA